MATFNIRGRRFRVQSLLVALCLTAGGPSHVFAKRKKDPHIQRIYELVFTAVSLKSEPVQNRRAGPSEGQFPHSVVTVHATVTNVTKQFPCTELRPILEVRPYYQYHPDLNQTSPAFGEMLPGQTVEVEYRFTTREGTTPVALSVKARQIHSDRCSLHSDWGSIWHARDEVRVPVDDLPEEGTGK